MQTEYIPFPELSFSKLFCTYVADYPKVYSFYNGDPFQNSDIKKTADQRVYSKSRKQLVSLLNAYNAPFQLHAAAKDNLEALVDPNTLTVVTGQQMVLGGGPLFTFFKTISTILYARRVQEITGKRVIPVFWLADEDHDFAEISRLAIPDQQSLRTFEIEESDHKKGFAVSRRQAGAHFEVFLTWLSEVLPDTEFRDEIISLLRNSCEKHCFKVSFARILSAIFSKYGVIFAGSDDKRIKEFLQPELQQAILKNEQLISDIQHQSDRISEEFHAQVKLQDTLLFYHHPEFGRERIAKTAQGNWKIPHDKEYTTNELIALSEKNPELFSPNVFLRPILQDALLPNVAYVAGPGELAYYGQMKSMYAHFDLQMPLIVPRMSATILETAISRIKQELPFSITDYRKRIEDLEQDFIAAQTIDDLEAIFNSWKSDVDNATEKYGNMLAKYDATLVRNAEKTTVAYHKDLDKLYQKLRKSVRNREEIQLQRIRKIKHSLFPGEGLQEREISGLYFLSKYGLDFWDQIIQMSSDADTKQHLVFRL